jgi:hypothetical protein
LLKNCGIEPNRRAETLTIEEWRCLCDFVSKTNLSATD